MNRIKRALKRKDSVSESLEHSELGYRDVEDDPPCIRDRKHNKLIKAKRSVDSCGKNTVSSNAPENDTQKDGTMDCASATFPADLDNPPPIPAMVIDQDILDLFPAPPQHGQARKSDISAFAFPSKTTPVLDNHVFAYPANEKPLPVLPLNLDRVSANQRKIRRGAISSASQRAPFTQNSAITNQNAWGPPPSAPPDMPLPPLPSQSPLSSRRLHSASGQALRNKSSFFIDRPVRRAKSTRSLGANVRLQPGPVSYNPTVIHRQHTHTNLHLRYLRPIPDVPADVGVDMVVTADPTDSVKENDGVSRKGSRKSNCRCAILFDESGNFVKRTGHYLTTCPLYNGGER